MPHRDNGNSTVTELPKTELPLVSVEELLQRGYRYAMSLTHDQASAEDLVQDAWLAVLRAGGARTVPYMFSSIRSRFLNRKHREQSVPMLQLDEAQDRGMLSEAAGIATNMGDGFDQSLERALASLRAVEREALFLAVVEGYTADEIGKLTGQSRGSVLSLLHRAREKARKFLEDLQPRIKR
jgi:RNA polymerase sigma-70 factor, ECF subfamily